MNKRNYTKQYKENAVSLCKARGNTAAVARELGIWPSTLRRWKKEKRAYAHNSFPGHGKAKLTDDQKRIVSLQKKLKDKELELEILKKAISIFSKSDRKNIGL